jgi:hypothetical protein
MTWEEGFIGRLRNCTLNVRKDERTCFSFQELTKLRLAFRTAESGGEKARLRVKLCLVRAAKVSGADHEFIHCRSKFADGLVYLASR